MPFHINYFSHHRATFGAGIWLFEIAELSNISQCRAGQRQCGTNPWRTVTPKTGKQPGAQLGDPPSFDPSIYNDCLTILTR